MEIRERNGHTLAMKIVNTDKATMQSMILENVESALMILTDEHSAYVGLDYLFLAHETVNHVAGEY
jgi:transposase-like protein